LKKQYKIHPEWIKQKVEHEKSKRSSSFQIQM
jgi:hypothetical protein